MNEKSLLTSKNLSNCNAQGVQSHQKVTQDGNTPLHPTVSSYTDGLKWYCHQGNILWDINSMINKILSNCIVTPPNLHNHFHVFFRGFVRG